MNVQSKEWNAVANEVSFSLDLNWGIFNRELSKESKVLEYGCGYGRNLAKLKDMGFTSLVGYDSSSSMVVRGNISFSALNLFVNSGIGIEEENESFDCVFLCAVLTCLPNRRAQKAVIEEVYRLLKPDGLLYLCEFIRVEGSQNYRDGRFKSKMGINMKHFGPNEVADLVESFRKIGLQIMDSETISGKSARSIHYAGRKPAIKALESISLRASRSNA